MEEYNPNQNYVGFSWLQRWIYPPMWWLVNSSAYIHDKNYATGGNKEDRLKADIGFFWRAFEDANKIEDYKKKKRAVMIVILYYILVRLFGWISFNKIKEKI